MSTATEAISNIISTVLSERPAWAVDYLDNAETGIVSSVTFDNGIVAVAHQFVHAELGAEGEDAAAVIARLDAEAGQSEG